MARDVIRLIVMLYGLLGWLALTAFMGLPNKLPVLNNGVCYFCNTIVVVSSLDVAGQNMKRIEPDRQLDLYIAGQINRLMFFTLMLLLFTNLFFRLKSIAARSAVTLGVWAILNANLWLTVKLGILHYNRWNTFYSALLIALWMAAALLAQKVYHTITEKDRRHASVRERV